LSLVSYVLILLYGSKRSKLGFNYDVSNKDDLSLHGYFREKLSIFQKIKFLFIGDADSTVMNEMSDLIGMSGGYDLIPGDSTLNIFTPPLPKKNDGKTTLRKLTNFVWNPNNRKMSIFWIVILVLCFIFIFGLSVFFQHFIVKACNNNTMSSVAGGLLSFNLITFGHIGSFIFTVCLFMFSMKQNYAGDTDLEDKFHHNDATRKTLLEDTGNIAQYSLDILKTRLDSSIAIFSSITYNSYLAAAKFFSVNIPIAIEFFEVLNTSVCNALNEYFENSSANELKDSIKASLAKFSRACSDYINLLRTPSSKDVPEDSVICLRAVTTELKNLIEYCKKINLTNLIEIMNLLFSMLIGILLSPGIDLVNKFISFFSKSNVQLRQNNFNKTVNKYMEEYESNNRSSINSSNSIRSNSSFENISGQPRLSLEGDSSERITSNLNKKNVRKTTL
jgi:hypothetical protein